MFTHINFSKILFYIQETPWYRSFLNAVIDEISVKGKLLDIGTGPGKLIQILATEKGMDCTGIDTNPEMLKAAQKKITKMDIKLLEIKNNAPLPFSNNSFEYVTICSVLFHLKKDSIDFILQESQRILKDTGKIIILTPTGKGNFFTLSKRFLSVKNLSIYIWFYATKNRAESWMNEKYLQKYADIYGLNYKREIVMFGFAQLEVISN